MVYISGVIFTMRDMAHIRLMKQLDAGKKPVENFRGSVIFHAGPVVEKQNGGWTISVIGSTTSMRMESFSERIFGELGVKAVVGKGGMGEKTREALVKYCGVYMLASPGCAVVQAKSMRKVLRVHWLDLGDPEALWVMGTTNCRNGL